MEFFSPLPIPDARDYMWELSPEDEAEVTAAVAKQLAEEAIEMVYGFEEMIPGINRVSGREQLAFYEAQDITYWQQLLALYPAAARDAFLEFARLYRRYGNDQLI